MSSTQISINSNGLSGSLQRLATGETYLVAGENMSVVTQSNGQIVLSSSFANDAIFEDAGTLADVLTLYTGSNQPVQLVSLSGFDGKFLFIPNVTLFQPNDVNQLLIDIDFGLTSSVQTSSNDILYVENAASASQYMTGSGHSPTYGLGNWTLNNPGASFSAPSNVNDAATTYLITQLNSLQQSELSNGVSSWADFSIFLVAKSNNTQSNRIMLSLGTGGNNTLLEIKNGSVNVWSEDQSQSSGGTLHTANSNRHLYEVHMLGDGTYTCCDNGIVKFSGQTDYRHKSCQKLILGAGKSVSQGSIHAGWDGVIARVLIFDRILSNSDAVKVRNYLNSKYFVY